ncbi:MAG: TonB-dependent receptor [Hyphomonadaceae bacterium]|nr:TonB-dependent receptor [Hyphomonadaceae bacterium]
MRKMWTSALALTTLCGMAAGQAAAQTVETETVVSDEIVVTVQLREQQLSEVPIAVTAFDGDFLDKLGIDRFEELALYVPGLEVQEQSANNPGFVIRGITSDSGEATVEARVAVFQDGVSISRSRGSYVELFDMERIEVSKGPQATLFGRGALIGAVNLVQNKPDLDANGFRLEAGFGEDEYRRVLGVWNAVLAEDVFAMRIAATTRRRDGFVDNTLDPSNPLRSMDVDAGRVSFRYEPNANWRFDLIGNVHIDDNTGTAFKSGTFAPAGGSTSPYTPAALATFGGFEGGAPLGLNREVYSLTFLAAYDINEAFTLNATTGWRTFDSVEIFDPDGSSLPILIAAEDAAGYQWSQDFRLGYQGDGPLSWFIGASYFTESGRQRVPLQYDERVLLALFADQITAPQPQSTAVLTNSAFTQALLGGLGIPATARPAVAAALRGNYGEQFTNSGETDSIDIYADATYALTDRLDISAGVRWSQDDKTTGFSAQAFGGGSVLGTLLALPSLPAATQAQVLQAIALTGRTPLGTGILVQPTAGGATQFRSETFDDFTWRLVGRYEVSDATSVWASYARGRRPDVIAPSAPSAPGGNATFRIIPAETVDSFEIGARTELLDGALDLDGSIYHYTYENFQTTEFDGARLVTINAGEASATGFEGLAAWSISDALDAFVTYAYSEARLDAGAREGNRFRLSPDHSLAIGGTASFPLFGGTLALTPSYTWQSEVFFDDDNDRADLQRRTPAAFSDLIVDEKQDAYGLLNFRARYTAEGGRYAVEAFITNALDEEYLIDAGNTGDALGLPTFIRGAPRLIGVELTAQF